METVLATALGLVSVVAIVVAIYAWDLRALCTRQQKELWALRETLLVRRRRARRESLRGAPAAAQGDSPSTSRSFAARPSRS